MPTELLENDKVVLLLTIRREVSQKVSEQISLFLFQDFN